VSSWEVGERDTNALALVLSERRKLSGQNTATRFAQRSGESPEPRTGGEHFSGGYLRQVRSDRRFVAFRNERQQQSVVNENHQRANPQC
jgi:hypothetical protein